MLLENCENEETFLIYLFEREPELAELNSNYLPKWDTLVGVKTPLEIAILSLYSLLSNFQYIHSTKAFQFYCQPLSQNSTSVCSGCRTMAADEVSAALPSPVMTTWLGIIVLPLRMPQDVCSVRESVSHEKV